MKKISSEKFLKFYLNIQRFIFVLNIFTVLFIISFIIKFTVMYIQNYLLETLFILILVSGDIVLYIILTNIAINATKKLINNEQLNETENYSKTLFPFITVVVYPLGIFYIYIISLLANDIKDFI